VNTGTWILENPMTRTRSVWALALGSLLFAALTGLGAALSFPLPFSPVPVTLQTFAVVMAGAMLGPIWGPVSMMLYISAGVAGMPVFAGGLSGPGILVGPTGGYLVGFVVAAWLAGLLVRPGVSWPRLALGLVASHLAVFVCGVSQLMLFTGQSFPLALELGVLPFLPGLAAKVTAAAGFLRSHRLTGWFR
jgi:biotin transport system substrate-specific component